MTWDYDWGRSTDPEECRELEEKFGELTVLALDRERGLALVDAPWEGWFAPRVRPFKSVCAWCGKTLREGPEPVSHGICESCAEENLVSL